MFTSCSQRVLINFVTLWDVSLDGGGIKVYYKRLLPPKTSYRFRKQSLSRYCLLFFFFLCWETRYCHFDLSNLQKKLTHCSTGGDNDSADKRTKKKTYQLTWSKEWLELQASRNINYSKLVLAANIYILRNTCMCVYSFGNCWTMLQHQCEWECTSSRE